MTEKKKLSFLGKDDQHIIKRNVIHNVESSASYRIGNTQVVCGITSEIKQHIQDGTKPKIFDIRLENSGLCIEKSPVINTISTWIDEIINDDELFGNKSKGAPYEGYLGNEAVVSPVTGILLEYGTYTENDKGERINLDINMIKLT